MKKGAIFDMDGLLFDSERIYQEKWIETAEIFGQVPHPDFPRAVCGSSGAHGLEIVHQYYPTVDAKEFWDTCMRLAWDQLLIHVPKKPGVDALLEFLRANDVKLAVASSSTRKMILHNLETNGVLQYFDAVVSGEDIINGKPAPDIFLKAAEQIGCEPQECYVFEDGYNGIRAGAAAGCVTVMVPDLLMPTDEMRQLSTAICSDLQEVLSQIQNNII